MLSQYSFGTYRTTYLNPLHREALKYALENGITHIDTSSNYMNGEAEQLVGQAIENIKREDITIVSKGGYIQGQNLQRVQEGYKVDELVRYDANCFHSISQDFLSDQIDNSLQRMKTDYIDTYLLHNPEYYLMKEIKKGLSQEKILEHHNIMQLRYGISSNAFSKKRSDLHFLEYKHLLGYANEVSNNNHHLKVIQLPMNMYETNGEEAAKWAYENGLEVHVNRPLNAFNKNKMLRLASYNQCLNFDTILEQIQEIPNEHLQEVIKQLLDIKNEYKWAGDVDDTIEYQVIPYIIDNVKLDPIYFQLFDNFLDCYKNNIKHKLSIETAKEMNIKGPIDSVALKFLEDKEYITRILVGMRHKRYVDKILAFNK